MTHELAPRKITKRGVQYKLDAKTEDALIREYLDMQGAPVRELGRKYGLSRFGIYKILARRGVPTWKAAIDAQKTGQQ